MLQCVTVWLVHAPCMQVWHGHCVMLKFKWCNDMYVSQNRKLDIKTPVQKRKYSVIHLHTEHRGIPVHQNRKHPHVLPRHVLSHYLETSAVLVYESVNGLTLQPMYLAQCLCSSVQEAQCGMCSCHKWIVAGKLLFGSCVTWGSAASFPEC